MKRAFALVLGVSALVAAFASMRSGRVEAATHTLAMPAKGPITTDGAIAMRNIESDLLDAETRVFEDPTNVRAQLRRSNLVYLHARVTGDIDEMARSVALTDACVGEQPASAEARLLRAVQLQTLHRFGDARADLRHARTLGGDPKKIDALERELDWNAGIAGPTARAIRRAALDESVASLARLARLAHDIARYDEADALYARALAKIEDKDPIAVAMLEVQIGTNVSDAGDLERAADTFRRAVTRLPSYTAAREHLAETLHRLGRDEEAIALYEAITRTSTDPEFMGALAALYRTRGRVVEANALRARATARYEELLAKYPDAMAWHAAEYFAGEGADRPRALALLRRNADLRPNAESLDALARLEREEGEEARAADLSRGAADLRAEAARDE